ncbi:MAG: cation-translocating P-type ATPase, partial [Anaerolineae bacterium]|nr:cation-translocating P-type ATPase [Anaerolineae bacterium]
MMTTTTTYRVQGMDCAGCARELEQGIAKLPGVTQVSVDFATANMRVEGEIGFAELQARAQALGKSLQQPDAPAPAASRGFLGYLLNRMETRLALLGGAVLLLGVLFSIPALFIAATAIAGYPIARSGLRALLINRDFNINLLMTIAAIGALLIDETLEAATVIFLFAIGEALEGYTADRARDSLRGLMQLVPQRALRLVAGAHEVVPVEALRVDDHILVQPGERIPMDGIVTAGRGSVDQAPVTGESVPVEKLPGAEVFAGTVNGEAALEVRVTRLAADNTISRIIKLVEEAQSVRAPSQRLIDRFARWYTPGVVVLAVLVALMPPLLFNAPFYDLADGTQGWLYRALELLVIACPCSLVISTPVTIISAITAGARRGVLFKGGAHLEALGGVRAIAFDKTGTLTRGQPTLTVARSVDCEAGQSCDLCDDVLALAAAVEQRSAHPLAKAVVSAAAQRGLGERYGAAQTVSALAGRGVQGQVDGKLVTVGSHALFESEHPHSPALCGWVDQAEADGQTTMLLCDGDRVRGFIAVADEARPESAAIVRELSALGVHSAMLTGDTQRVAGAVGDAVGIADVRAQLMPAQKVDAVRDLLAQHGSVAMVGDGINDTPALAAATVGIAMGGAGSAQALETADIALMADDLRQLPYALRLSRFARRIIRQNIVVSLGLKAAFVLL